MPSRVSVVVVSFNTREKLRRCLQCIGRHYEIVVVDNASADGSAEMVRDDFPHVRLQRNEGNVGFGIANNQGCELATGDLVLFLNSDAYAHPGAIDALAEVFGDPETVAAGGELQHLDGRLQESTAARLTLGMVFLEQTGLDLLLRRFGNRNGYWRTEKYHAEWEQTHRPVEVPQVMGACLMVRAVEGTPPELFDPRFFLYCEDTDLCLRLQRHGKIVYYPPAKFFHELGSSSAKDPALGIVRYNRGKELYFRIHHGPVAEIVCFLLDRLGALLRLGAHAVIGLVKRRGRAAVGTWVRVLTAPRRSVEGSSRTPEPPRPATRSV
jgi:GT2 family glycosyltransferase